MNPLKRDEPDLIAAIPVVQTVGAKVESVVAVAPAQVKEAVLTEAQVFRVNDVLVKF